MRREEQEWGVTPTGPGSRASHEAADASSPKASIPNAAHTPGPWGWFGNARNNEVYLATAHSGRLYVMGFQRWGMRGAQPTFQPAKRGLVPAADLFTFEVGDRSIRGVAQARADDSVYRLDINGIDCADARLIAAAPELLADLEFAVKLLRPFGATAQVQRMEATIAKARGSEQ